MNWLKKQQSIQLYQSSTIPYIILEDGIHLCYDNFYSQQKENKQEYNLCFNLHNNTIKRANTFLYKLSNFPTVVPFSHIIYLNDIIIESRLIKQSSFIQDEPKTISIIKGDKIPKIHNLDKFSEKIEHIDYNFILIDQSVSPQVRLFEDISTILPHKEWNRTMTAIADHICQRKDRKYCWTKSVPELTVHYYGNQGENDIPAINDSFEHIGLEAVVDWAL